MGVFSHQIKSRSLNLHWVWHSLKSDMGLFFWHVRVLSEPLERRQSIEAAAPSFPRLRKVVWGKFDSLVKRLKRREMLAFFAKQPACTVSLEACGSSHYWGREIKALGHVKLWAM